MYSTKQQKIYSLQTLGLYTVTVAKLDKTKESKTVVTFPFLFHPAMQCKTSYTMFYT